MTGKPTLMAKGDVEREARRVFRRLAEAEAVLRPIEGSDGRYGVFVRRNRFARAVLELEQAHVLAFRQRDWLEPAADDALVLNQVGRAWYRRSSGGPERFRAQHQLTQRRTVPLADGSVAPVTVNAGESPLGWLRNRKDAHGRSMLDGVQFDAGERFREDFERARMMPRVTSSWASPVGAGARRRSGAQTRGDNLSDAVIAAKKRVFSALAAVGPDLAGIVIEVCCNLSGLKDAERLLGMPQRSGKVVLQIALNQLARHYGLLRDEFGPDIHRCFRHWGGDDYRPTIDG